MTSSNTMISTTQIISLAKEASEKYHQSENFVNSLLSIQLDFSETFQALVTQEENRKANRLGYLLGIIKSNYDTLPDSLADSTTINGVSINTFIKQKVDENVLNPREKLQIKGIALEKDYWRTYQKLSKFICGFGTTMTFSDEHFINFFPRKISHFVRGFANGYSDGFHAIAAESNIKTTRTHPIHQDIWKNFPFFLDHDVFDYRLDGKYIFMYQREYGISSDGSDGQNDTSEKMVNKDVYTELKNRPIDSFVSNDFICLDI